jgi:DNA-binding GntR family transcriptional regulator
MYWINKYSNSLLIDFINQVMDRQQRIRYVTVQVENRMFNTIPEHIDILEAIRSKDIKAVSYTVQYHIGRVKNEVINYLEQENTPRFTKLIYHLR